MKNKKYYYFLSIGIIILILTVIFYTGMGYIKISFSKVLKIILETLLRTSKKDMFWYVIIQVRLPRILSSIIAGTALSLSGVIFQSSLLNPLADPYTLGISSGASFGAAISILCGFNFFGIATIPFFAFIFSLMTLFLVIRLGTYQRRLSSVSLILSGIIVSAFFSAGLSLIKYLSNEEVSSIIFWLMGSFSSRTWAEVLILFLFTFIGFIITILYSNELNIISLGEKNANSLGVNTNKIRILLLINASLMSSIVVSINGIIGFVGLIVPHLIRIIIGTDNRKLIVLSSIWGAIILSTADNITRAILPIELPIGVLTSLIGAPFFLIIFRKKMRRNVF
ncbi:corrinoid ABC transporter permease [Tepiditoga spiralis]|uniref:Corrinoid ABC transporter permease n=1 Tax=Tepiditoga spiralis TaxID=2108365 RepID=A0A7G1G621_9BACT|nr:iron ABC transporter permease [Tepiditoga spiralis]BBE31615.1 corrinoid ABC transporter permease [Tepiditoga spiralis]